MGLYRIQGNAEKRQGIFYEFDPQEEPLGVGGMGKVYKGFCINEKSGSSRPVAIKFMYDDLPPHVIERARREAAIQLRHENLVEMLGFIETEDKGPLGDIRRHYHVVSELLEGVMLDDLLQGKLADRNGNLVPFAQKLYGDFQRDVYRFATFIIRNILSGLMTLHDAGYIHRDIDPTNIMVTSDGHVKLIDFGIAKQMRSLTTHDKSLTVAGAFMGKPEYAAPELVLGDIKNQNQTTDIYAVGILLFQCIVGHPPFEGDRHEVLQMQLHKKLPLHLIKNKQLRAIIATATDKTRSKRYQSAAEFRVAMEHLPVQLKDDVFDSKFLYGIAAAVFACICIGGGAFFFWPKSQPAPSTVISTPQEPAEVVETPAAPPSDVVPQPDDQPPVPEEEEIEIKDKSYDDLYREARALCKEAEGMSGDDKVEALKKALALFQNALTLAREAKDREKERNITERMGNVQKELNSLKK